MNNRPRKVHRRAFYAQFADRKTPIAKRTPVRAIYATHSRPLTQASPATREARCAPLRACAPRVTSGLRLGAGCAAGRRTHSRRLRSQSRRPVANNGRQRRPVHHNHNSNIKVNPTSAFLGITHQAQHHHIGIVPVSGALCRLSLHQKELHRVRELRRVTRVRLQKRGC